MSCRASPSAQSSAYDEDYGSDGEHVTKKPRPASSTSSTSDSNDGGVLDSPLVEDITAVALGRSEKNPRKASTAFDCTPAMPPGAYVSHRFGPGRPYNVLPSMAASQQYKRNALQRHVDSFSFYSRDRLESSWDLPRSRAGVSDIDHALRVDTFEQTGALLWFQAQCLDDASSLDGFMEPDGDGTAGHTYIDGAGRQQGQQRLLRSGTHAGGDLIDVDDETEETSITEAQISLQHCHLGISSYRLASPLYGRDHDVILYDFTNADMGVSGARALYHVEPVDSVDDPCARVGGWLVYDQSRFRATFATQLWSSKPGDGLSAITSLFPKGWISKGREELNLRIILEQEGDDDRWHLAHIHTAPHNLGFDKIPKPDGHAFRRFAVNEGSGYCWFGHDDGSVEFLNLTPWFYDNLATCPAIGDDTLNHPPLCSCGASEIEPFQVLPPSKRAGAVTNLVTVGRSEVIVAFSHGSVVRLRKAVEGTKCVFAFNSFFGHVNEEGDEIEIAVHAPSRLMAVRGTDDRLRIWHLDGPYPLNTPWHRPRAPQQNELLLLPHHQDEPDSSSSSPGAQDDDDDDDTWTRLATENVDKPQFAQVKKARLADIRVQPFCGMAWTPTSWMADRDVQWEMWREFDEKGRPKLVSAGLLPSLACCSDRARGTTFLYFEPERRVGVEGVGDGQEGASEEREMEEEGPSAFNNEVEVEVEDQGGN